MSCSFQVSRKKRKILFKISLESFIVSALIYFMGRLSLALDHHYSSAMHHFSLYFSSLSIFFFCGKFVTTWMIMKVICLIIAWKVFRVDARAIYIIFWLLHSFDHFAWVNRLLFLAVCNCHGFVSYEWLGKNSFGFIANNHRLNN